MNNTAEGIIMLTTEARREASYQRGLKNGLADRGTSRRRATAERSLDYRAGYKDGLAQLDLADFVCTLCHEIVTTNAPDAQPCGGCNVVGALVPLSVYQQPITVEAIHDRNMEK